MNRTLLSLLAVPFLALLAVGCGNATDGLVDDAVAPTDSLASSTATTEDDGQVAAPSRIRIPAIAVDASMIPLGLRDDGSIDVPTDFAQTGWWVDGPEPGETGPAVILGHVDSRSGPAVFFDLDQLAPGDPIHVDRLDGTTVTYVVDRTEQHDKNAFPTETVYGSTAEPVLRLVTCGGQFDGDRRSYDDNVIVFARLDPTA